MAESRENKNNVLEPLTVTHGPIFLQETNLKQHITCCVFDEKKQLYMTVMEMGAVYYFHPEGKLVCIRNLETPVQQVELLRIANVWIGWTECSTTFCVMEEEMNEVANISHENPIQVLACGVKDIPEIFLIDEEYVFVRWLYESEQLIPVQFLNLSSTNLMHDSTTLAAHINTILLSRADEDAACYCAWKSAILVINYEQMITTLYKQLHNATITAIAQYGEKMQLLTASADGIIKLWSQHWEQLQLFLGHNGRVVQLTTGLWSGLFLSLSVDNTVRFWDASTVHEVGKLPLKTDRNRGLLVATQCKQLLIYSSCSLTWWKMELVYDLFATLRSPIRGIQSFITHSLPSKLIIDCKDGTCYCIDPTSANILCHVEIDANDAPALCVSPQQESIFIYNKLYNRLLHFSFQNHVTQAQCKELFLNCSVPITCMAAIETVDLVIGACQQTANCAAEAAGGKRKLGNAFIIFLGHENGTISSMLIPTDASNFINLSCHTDAVKHLLPNDVHNQLISVGEENCIKIWKIQFFEEHLLQLCRVVQCPFVEQIVLCSLLTVDDCLASALQHNTSIKQIVIYDFQNSYFHDHNPENSHNDNITCMSSSETLHVFASASMDKTIRIWSNSNELLRIVNVLHVTFSMNFMSPGGDLLMAYQRNIFKLHAMNYLPSNLLMKAGLLCAGTDVPSNSNSTQTTDALEAQDQLANRMLQVSNTNTENVPNEMKEFLMRLDERNRDLVMIRDGTYHILLK